MGFEKKSRRSKPISGITLLMLTSDRSFLGVFAYMISWNLILSMFCIFGSMSMARFLIYSALIDAGIFALAVHSSFRAKCGWHTIKTMHRLLKKKEWIKRLRGTMLAYRNDGWEYADREWFIRVNQGSACILFAPELDFSEAGVHTKFTIYDDFSKQRPYAKTQKFDRYTFQTKNGFSVTIQIDRADSFLKWIAAHGGRTVLR